MSRRVIRPTLSNAMLFICDIQEKFRPLIYNMPSVILKGELLNQSCHALHMPILITEQYPAALGTTVAEITRFAETKIFAKTKFSMMTDEFRSAIPTDRKQVILCGLESHVCLMQTALDLAEENYDVFVVCDAASSQRPYDRAMALERMQQAGVVLTTTESVLFDLMRDARHPIFKTVSAFIKAHKSVDDGLPKF